MCRWLEALSQKACPKGSKLTNGSRQPFKSCPSECQDVRMTRSIPVKCCRKGAHVPMPRWPVGGPGVGAGLSRFAPPAQKWLQRRRFTVLGATFWPESPRGSFWVSRHAFRNVLLTTGAVLQSTFVLPKRTFVDRCGALVHFCSSEAYFCRQVRCPSASLLF